MTVEISEEIFQILQNSVENGRFSTVTDALEKSVHMLGASNTLDEDWMEYAEERISAGLADVEAGRTIPAEHFLNELHRYRQKSA